MRSVFSVLISSLLPFCAGPRAGLPGAAVGPPEVILNIRDNKNLMVKCALSYAEDEDCKNMS